MQILDLAVEAIRNRREGTRERCAVGDKAGGDRRVRRSGGAHLAGLSRQAGRAGDKYTIVSWVGAASRQQLYELSLQAHVAGEGRGARRPAPGTFPGAG